MEWCASKGFPAKEDYNVNNAFMTIVFVIVHLPLHLQDVNCVSASAMWQVLVNVW
jgi:hypothetical protein